VKKSKGKKKKKKDDDDDDDDDDPEVLAKKRRFAPFNISKITFIFMIFLKISREAAQRKLRIFFKRWAFLYLYFNEIRKNIFARREKYFESIDEEIGKTIIVRGIFFRVYINLMRSK
jgi:hypothetical protein